jgi:hypothetical protein
MGGGARFYPSNRRTSRNDGLDDKHEGQSLETLLRRLADTPCEAERRAREIRETLIRKAAAADKYTRE